MIYDSTCSTESRPCENSVKTSEVAQEQGDSEATEYHSDNTVSQTSEYMGPQLTQSYSNVITEVSPGDKETAEDNTDVQDVVNETYKKSQTPSTNNDREVSGDQEENEYESSDDFQRDVTFDDESY